MRTAQPSKGRYFAIRPAEAWAEARQGGLVSGEPELPTRLLFVNPGRDSAGRIPLIQLVGPREIRMFSVPDRLDPERGRRAILRALELAARHRDSVAEWTQLKQVSLLVVLAEDDRLAVIAQTSWYQQRKYRGGGKFSTAFKMRKLKTQERHLETYAF